MAEWSIAGDLKSLGRCESVRGFESYFFLVKICLRDGCDNPILSKDKRAKYCSSSCAAKVNNVNKIRNPRNPNNFCPECGERKDRKAETCIKCKKR